eukprot:scaffold79542_cov22-Tisochrysis_lutea.AAC.3
MLETILNGGMKGPRGLGGCFFNQAIWLIFCYKHYSNKGQGSRSWLLCKGIPKSSLNGPCSGLEGANACKLSGLAVMHGFKCSAYFCLPVSTINGKVSLSKWSFYLFVHVMELAAFPLLMSILRAALQIATQRHTIPAICHRYMNKFGKNLRHHMEQENAVKDTQYGKVGGLAAPHCILLPEAEKARKLPAAPHGARKLTAAAAAAAACMELSPLTDACHVSDVWGVPLCVYARAP